MCSLKSLRLSSYFSQDHYYSIVLPLRFRKGPGVSKKCHSPILLYNKNNIIVDQKKWQTFFG